jgi:hypothetical protein
MFLMLESLLSDIRPQRSGEGENRWFRAALQEAHARYDLSTFGQVRPRREGEDLASDFASDARHKISHAKRQRNSEIPLDVNLRRELSDKLERLGALCMHLSDKHLGVRRSQSFVFPSFFRRQYGDMFDSMSIILTSESRPLDLDTSEVPIDVSLPHARTPARRATEYEDSHRMAVFARLSRTEFEGLNAIARIVTVSADERPVSASILEEVLEPSGAENIEVIAGIYMTNVRANRRHYTV